MLRFPRSSDPPARLQDLDAAQARFCLKAARFLHKELHLNLSGTHLVAGFSGGADSTALLLSLAYLAPKLGCTLSAAHLDHGLRPSSGREATLCRELCTALGIICHSGKASVPALAESSGCGTEESARNARYAFFTDVLRQTGGDWIVTGHTANDLAEDILMRLIRGAGWPGLSGMSALDPERRLLRPLLLTSREQIEGFLNSLGTGWLSDESNADQSCFRNRVRTHLLPFLMEENPAFLHTAANLWRLGRIDKTFFEQLLPELPEADKTARQPATRGSEKSLPATETRELVLSKDVLNALPQALRLRLYKKILDALGPGQARIAGLLALDAAWSRRGNPTEHHFPGAKIALVSGKGIVWRTGECGRDKTSPAPSLIRPHGQRE